MSIAIELYFDLNSEDTLRQIWQTIADNNIHSHMISAGYRPHISLVVYESEKLEIEKMRRDLAILTDKKAPFLVSLENVGLFSTAEGVIFLGVGMSSILLTLHKSFHHAFAAYESNCQPYYLPDRWVPHCTIAYGLNAEEMAKAVAICTQIALPIQVIVREIGIARVSPTKCDLLFTSQLISTQS